MDNSWFFRKKDSKRFCYKYCWAYFYRWKIKIYDSTNIGRIKEFD